MAQRVFTKEEVAKVCPESLARPLPSNQHPICMLMTFAQPHTRMDQTLYTALVRTRLGNSFYYIP